MRRAIKPFLRQRGVTLIEMIVAMVVTGIVLAMVGMFTRNQISSYIDVANRTELSDQADTALRRMARDLQGALPNSVRVSADTHFLEFVPIKDGGRYRAEVGNNAADDALDFSTADNKFDVLGPPVGVAAGDSLVVYNLGIPGADVYEGLNRRAATAGSASVTFTPVAATPLPFSSPDSRFQIVSKPVSYVCDLTSGTLWRYSGYAFQATQPVTQAALGNTRARLATDVSACQFNYAPGVLQRNGVIVLRLKLTRNGESVNLVHQLNVMNSP